MKIAGYRNYSSLKEKILEAQPAWSSNLLDIKTFLNGLKYSGGWGNEAIEIGL